jgi:glucose-6-phosphate isomerase
MEPLLTIDTGHLFSDNGAAGLVPRSRFDEFKSGHIPVFAEFQRSLHEMSSPLTLPLHPDNLSRIKSLAQKLRDKYDNVILLGIGGSSLGARAILQFIRGPYYNLEGHKPRLFFVDNIDPLVARTIASLTDSGPTALIYVSKSGSTPETAANFMYFYHRYVRGGGNEKDIVILCDPGENGINRIARKLDCELIHMPPDLQGRFSVLSCAGLLPAEVVGVDGNLLLAGAQWAHQNMLEKPPQENALFELGSALAFWGDRNKSIHVLYSYGSLLSEFGLWFMQLWGESLGKKLSLTGQVVNRGTTPLACLGATDQHSLLQLFKEGPLDKVIGFMRVEEVPDLVIPDEFNSEKEYNYFSGHSMKEQLHIEQLSTELSVFKAGNPCYRISLRDMSPQALGALFYFYENLVAFLGQIWQVNPFDQPGVEEGKKTTYSLMGRQDYADKAAECRAEVAGYEAGRKIFTI